MSLLLVKMTSLNVYAADHVSITDISELSGYEMLTDDAKELIAELSINADSVTSFIPETKQSEDLVTSDSVVMDILGTADDQECDDEAAYILISETINSEMISGVVYEDVELTLVTLSTTYTFPGSYQASGQAYGVAAVATVYITWRFTDVSSYSDLAIKFNSIIVKYTYLPTQSTTVTQMVYSAFLAPTSGMGSYTYQYVGSISNPTSGTNYSNSINSSYYLYDGVTAFVMLDVYYANGASSRYSFNIPMYN